VIARRFPTVQLYLATDHATDHAGSGHLVRDWYEQSWAALGHELRDWFTSADHRRRWRSRLPSAVVELSRSDGPDRDTWLKLIDTDLMPSQWEWFLSGLDGSARAALDAGEQLRDRWGRPYFRANSLDSIYGLDVRHHRYGASDAVLATVACHEFLLTAERQEATVEFFHRAVNTADVTYGEIAYIGTGLDHTALEYAFGALGSDFHRRQMRTARQVLRGYGWVTVVPKEIAMRLGGARAMAATGAFAETRDLDGGGLWLRATASFGDYDLEAATRVARALADVLPAGRPVPSSAAEAMIAHESIPPLA